MKTTRQFRYWLIFFFGSAITSFVVNYFAFIWIAPEIYWALSLLETLIFSVISIPFTYNVPE